MKLQTHFVSEIDKQLKKFNQQHARSAAQEAEFQKYQKLNRTRDEETGEAAPATDPLWD